MRQNLLFIILGLTLCATIYVSYEPSPPTRPQEISMRLDFPNAKPVGPLPESLAWVFKDGPDFYLYRTLSASPTPPTFGAGIYFGYHPSPKLDGTAPTLPGKIAGKTITWRIGTIPVGDESYLYRETAFFYPPHEVVPEPGVKINPQDVARVHLWIYAAAEDGMSQMINALEELVLQELAEDEKHGPTRLSTEASPNDTSPNGTSPDGTSPDGT